MLVSAIRLCSAHGCRMLMVSMLLLVFPLSGYSFEDCGSLKADHRVDNYRHSSPQVRKHLDLVESHHFQSHVELLRSKNLRDLLYNLDYTLRHFPNHPRALYAVSKFQRQLGGPFALQRLQHSHPYMAGSWPRSAECYFRRAIQFQPKDPSVYLVFAIHLHLSGELDEALDKYKMSEKLYPRSAELHYNLGLLYFDRKEYDLAKQHAHKAYRLGYQLPGLRNKLTSIDQWP